MRIKDHQLYELYLAHLESKKFNSGQLTLARMSASLFEEFCVRIENDPYFKSELNLLYVNLRRKNLIREILDVDTIFSQIN